MQILPAEVHLGSQCDGVVAGLGFVGGLDDELCLAFTFLGDVAGGEGDACSAIRQFDFESHIAIEAAVAMDLDNLLDLFGGLHFHLRNCVEFDRRLQHADRHRAHRLRQRDRLGLGAFGRLLRLSIDHLEHLAGHLQFIIRSLGLRLCFCFCGGSRFDFFLCFLSLLGLGLLQIILGILRSFGGSGGSFLRLLRCFGQSFDGFIQFLFLRVQAFRQLGHARILNR